MKLSLPLTKNDIIKLKVGDIVELTGYIYTARDAAHKKLVEIIEKGLALPFPIINSIIYYTGPTPKKPGSVIGSCGPTTSYRMDSFMDTMASCGQLASIGKGERDDHIIELCKEKKMIYFLATGGIGALLSKKIKEAKIIAFPELGPEAIRKIYVEDFPVIVAYDTYGNSIFKE